MKALYRFSSVVICVVSVLLIISPSFSLAETCPPLIWDTKVTISNDSGESYWPRITADGNIIHVSWMNYETSTAFYKRSLDNGATWQDHHEFSAYLYSNFDVIAYDNVSTAVWLDKSGSQQIVRSTYSENAGETWPYSIQDISPVGYIKVCAIANEGNFAVVCWKETNGNTYFKTSNNGGITWSGTITVPYNTSSGTCLDVTIANSVIVIGYIDDSSSNKVLVIYSDDNGTNWCEDNSGDPLLVGSASEILGLLTMDSDGSSVIMRWKKTIGSYNDDTFVANSIDSGKTWGTAVMVADGSESPLDGSTAYGDVAIKGNKSYVLIRRNQFGQDLELWYRCSLDNGITWDPPIKINHGITKYDMPRCVAINGSLNIVGYAPSSTPDIWFVRGEEPNQAPISDTGQDQTVIESETVWFDGSASSDPDGTIVSYEWDFGDGEPPESGVNVSHVYSTDGIYTVTLTVTDDDDATCTDDAIVTVLTPAGAIDDLINIVEGMNLQQGIENSLDAKLDAAQDALIVANADQRNDAIKKLEALIQAVEAQRGKKLTNEQADQLVEYINRIISALSDPPLIPRPVITNLPENLLLNQNSPNPFNPATTIEYGIPAGTSRYVTLKVYDLRGALVKTLVDNFNSSGVYSVVWDGTDKSGNRVSSGIYIYTLQAGEFTKSNKMMLMR